MPGKTQWPFFIPDGWKIHTVCKYDSGGNERFCYVFTNRELKVRRSFCTSWKIQSRYDAFVAFWEWYKNMYENGKI